MKELLILPKNLRQQTAAASASAMRKIKNLNYITSMKITVTDENNEIIDFNNLPLLFQI